METFYRVYLELGKLFFVMKQYTKILLDGYVTKNRHEYLFISRVRLVSPALRCTWEPI